MKADNFDLVFAIPLKRLKGRKKLSKEDLEKLATASLEKISDGPIRIGEATMNVKNDFYNKENLKEYANIFCDQIHAHGEYELVFSEESNINIERHPLAYGHVVLYKDEKNDEYNPDCCYRFFAALSELSLGKDSADSDVFNLVFFVVPDINYHDATLLMDQSFEIWCNIMGKDYGELTEEDEEEGKKEGFFRKYLREIGYKYMGKIYRIIFSDERQFTAIMKEGKTKLFNILAAEEYKNEKEYSHQLTLSGDDTDYILTMQGKDREVTVTEKEKFYDDFTMYSSYNAYASLYSYYYVINEEKDTFKKRIEPDENNGDFSSEANILFVLETEIFKITACLVLSDEINRQIDSPDMGEIEKMFKSFINTRPLFEKLNYCYLGAQKEADFMFQQFRISDMLDDYDRKRELLKNYSEVITSITADRNAKILNCIGLIFTLIAGFPQLSFVSRVLFSGQQVITWNNELIVPILTCVLCFGIIIKISGVIKPIRKYLKSRFNKD